MKRFIRSEPKIGAVITDPGNSSRNKTGGWRAMKPVKDKSKCTKCGICWQFCPDNAINEKFEIDLKYCKGCGICAKECVFNAIKMIKEEK
ncbi:MAG: 4Fe-4S binding protein [Candidatus Woesearchaeota archaeon]